MTGHRAGLVAAVVCWSGAVLVDQWATVMVLCCTGIVAATALTVRLLDVWRAAG